MSEFDINKSVFRDDLVPENSEAASVGTIARRFKNGRFRTLISDVGTFLSTTVSTALGIPSYTTANLPAAGNAGNVARVTDGLAAGALVIDDGTAWNVDAAKSQKIVVVTAPPYNAKGDGVTDDTAAFNAATAVGRPVFVPDTANSYLIVGPFTNTANVPLLLYGRATLTGAGAPTSGIITIATGGKVNILGSAPTSALPAPLSVSGNSTTSVAGGVSGVKVEIAPTAGPNPIATDFVAGYFRMESTARPRVWALNPLTDVTSGQDATAWGAEVDVNNSTGVDAPDPHNTLHKLGVDVVSGGTARPSSAFSTLSTSLTNRWKHGIWFDSIGGIAGARLISAESNISVDYGLDLRGLAAGIPTYAAAAIRLPNNANIGWRNAADAADVPAVYVNGSNALVLGQGTPGTILNASGGLQVNSPTGGDKGAGAVNVSGAYYVNGVNITPTLTVKSGSGAADYTTTSATYVDVDATNLAYTVTIPTGWKLYVTAACEVKNSTLAAAMGLALFDTVGTGAVIAEELVDAAVAGDREHMGLTHVVTGDGAAHTIKLQWKASAATSTMGNSSATLSPRMTFILSPSQ